MIPALTSHKALCFDCYGTIIDWESNIYDRLQPLLTASSTPFTRPEALQAFVSVEADLQAKHPAMPYTQLLAHVYSALGQRLGLAAQSFAADSAPAVAFGESVGDWTPFADSPAALGELKKRFKLVVLSNVDRSLFDRTRRLVERPGGFVFDKIITAQDVGSYKPALANFEYMLNAVGEEFGIKNDEVLVVAQSRMHDHVPANALGLHSAWIDREGAAMGHDENANYTYRFNTLAEMAKAVEQELTTVPA